MDTSKGAYRKYRTGSDGNVTFTAASWGLVSIVGYLLPVCQPLHSRVPLGAVVLLNTQLPCVAFDALFIRYSARPLHENKLV